MKRLLQLNGSSKIQPSTFQDWENMGKENAMGWESGCSFRNSGNRFGSTYYIISNTNDLR
jgi:hypothetical protein